MSTTLDPINLNENEIFTIKLITQILTGISLFSLLLVLLLFWFFKSIRSFALELIVWLCISNIIFNICYYLPTYYEITCTLQAILEIAFDMSSFLWTTIIGYTAYISLMKLDHLEKYKTIYRVVFVIIANFLPLIYSLM
jgi:hypothetical protein